MRRRLLRTLGPILLLGGGVAARAVAQAPAAAPPPEQIDFFEAKIRPLLVAKCYECHDGSGANSVKGAFSLHTRDGILKGGESGKPAVVPGNAEQSPLIRAVKRSDPKFSMPPKEQDRLTPEQIADFEAWVVMGAPDPRASDGPLPQTSAEKARAHWAFNKPVEPAIPAVTDAARVRNPIDAFVLSKLKEMGLAPAPIADKRTLIRRATFDLHGLPPTPAEVEAFVNDSSPDAFEKLIDRLLASPRYGERWGRYWLDVARYADTKGYVFEEERRFPFSFTYRDWVIHALNEDLPYDQFLVQQIAADRLPLGDDKRPLAAMGFLTVGRRFLNNQPDIIDDRIDVVTRGAMALTVQCARCHDHKYDPIPIEDYYSLYGVFEASPESRDPPVIATLAEGEQHKAFEAELAKRQAELKAFMDERLGALREAMRKPEAIASYLLAAYDVRHDPQDRLRDLLQERDLRREMFARWRMFIDRTAQAHHPVMGAYHAYAAIKPDEFVAKVSSVTDSVTKNADAQKPFHPLIAKAFAERPPETMKDVCDRYGELLAGADAPEPHADADREALRQVLRADGTPTAFGDDNVRGLFDREEANRARDLRKKVDELQASHPGAPPRAMTLDERPDAANPRVFLRGNANTPGPEVPRRFLKVLAGVERKPFQNGSGRLELAQAIASKDNPLTARVMVNRVWIGHFGQGLVRTPSDFGIRSDPPTHPELVDWLALRFTNDCGWSLKKLHKLVMLSATYQQSSTGGDDTVVAADPQNLLLSRQNRRRLEFEGMRDALIAVTGRLDTTMGGKGVELAAEPFTMRRTIYGFVERQNLPAMFRTFDFASPDTHSPQRFFTTVPQQALFMMNSPFVVQQARHLAARDVVANEQDPVQRVRRLYAVVFGRDASEDEVAIAIDFLRGETMQQPRPAAWAYGYGVYDSSAQRVTTFTPLPKFTGSAWQGGDKLPDEKLGWLVLHPQGGHPSDRPDGAAIRRWTAPADGAIAIDGELRHPSEKGNGVQARIVSSRSGELASWAVHHGAAQTKLENIEVRAGDTIDFVVECRGDVAFDNFTWPPTIRLARPQLADAAGNEGVTDWNAAADFAGPDGGGRLSPWEKYAQVLLQSNEFMFVD